MIGYAHAGMTAEGDNSVLMQKLGSTLESKLTNGKPLFQIWMGEEFNTIQSAAKAFGERMCFEQTLDIITLDLGPRTILETLLRLWGLTLVETYLSWYLTRQLMTPQTGLLVPKRVREVVASVGEYSLALCGMGVDERLLFAPIAGDLGGWEEYNRSNNHGELLEKSQLDTVGFNPHNAFGRSKL
ncbi:hypothetical protein BG015_002482 [Linnemannia schmuckeri]|uniref:Acyl-CoA oxidase C-terminal domain-containing protein n=1 Tax=Linnemannia schmuckeri TaxID=64567 RepID=A0A9P5RNX3_9FUNG|nr:hypothetical protein BG015_002482 [Linnemannia schmuckeri]